MFPPRHRSSPTIQLTSLIDVVFILLVFVLLAASFTRHQKLDIDLPNAATASPLPPTDTMIEIAQDGSYWLHDKSTGHAQKHAIEDEDLAAILVELKQQGAALTISAHRTSALERTVNILDRAAHIAFPIAALVTERTPKKATP